MKRKFKVGDKVLLKNKRGKDWNINGKMDHYIGKIVTISKIVKNDYFEIEEDNDEHFAKWRFDFNDIEILVTLTLNDLQFADILTLRNGKRYVVADGLMQGEKASYSRDCDEITNWYNDDLTQNEENQDEDIVKVERAGQVIFEREEVHNRMTVREIEEKLGITGLEIVKEDK